MDLKNMTAKEVRDCIMEHSKGISDDEWLEISKWISNFLESDPPMEEKKMFGPLSCAEMVTIICDGIIRWRNSICIKCNRQKGKKKYRCEMYPGNEEYTGSIPNEIWANENANCPHFQAIQEK